MVILATEEQSAPRKARKIEVLKAGVYKDVDYITHKFTEGNEGGTPQTRNERVSDATEDLDGAIISRSVQYADARLRTKLQAFLAEETVETADSRVGLEDVKFTYNLNLPESVPDSILKAIAEHFHRFLVHGALVDWFGQFGLSNQAVWYEKDLDSLEEKITSKLRGKSIAKRPMQPFGPAKMPR